MFPGSVRRGNLFILIELLLVVSVVAVPAGMLLSVLNGNGSALPLERNWKNNVFR